LRQRGSLGDQRPCSSGASGNGRCNSKRRSRLPSHSNSWSSGSCGSAAEYRRRCSDATEYAGNRSERRPTGSFYSSTNADYSSSNIINQPNLGFFRHDGVRSRSGRYRWQYRSRHQSGCAELHQRIVVFSFNLR
jgi:hypothetical protein